MGKLVGDPFPMPGTNEFGGLTRKAANFYYTLHARQKAGGVLVR